MQKSEVKRQINFWQKNKPNLCKEETGNFQFLILIFYIFFFFEAFHLFLHSNSTVYSSSIERMSKCVNKRRDRKKKPNQRTVCVWRTHTRTNKKCINCTYAHTHVSHIWLDTSKFYLSHFTIATNTNTYTPWQTNKQISKYARNMNR